MSPTRPPILAGTWYPEDPAILDAAVRSYLDGADRPVPARPLVAIVPHAGYAYSGPTAGRLYGLLAGHAYERIFILAPSHRMPLGRVALPESDAFATPRGAVPVDVAVVSALAGSDAFAVAGEAHASEHAIEIQLPFLQATWSPPPPIVPLLVPAQREEDRRTAAAALARWSDGSSLFVVSTDMTHYGRAYGYVPFRDSVPEQLEKLDGGAIDRMLARDPAGLLEYAARTGITMCGLHAAALALSLPWPAGTESRLVDYRRSADRDRDYSMSVSYAALLLTAPREESA